ncbi:MAG: dTMP kinase [Rhodospirillales bacterium]|nr:dTMP kinase [Rhodospirillales bacterium]
MAAGRFITLEGGEGAGKSTQARRLAAALARAGQAVLLTREPGGTAGAERLRAVLLEPGPGFVPLAETMLHFAARAEHVARVIRPALAAGMWVICDRFTDSTRAYQGGGQGVEAAVLEALAGLIGLEPELTLLLEASPAVAAERLAKRAGMDRYEALDGDFHARVAAAFRALAEAAPGRIRRVDADGPEDAVAARIADVLAARFAGAFTPG